ncbi:hypothetical protein SASPL_154186 [Salvia splendens]|uniref:Reverse transcriptase Ty1/copia-type domain-containing protein n=1 Tax=Salvia splendens TaxID=180675 RepID=A0A8X8VZN3_SALSN|nr:hypothetical protein SASPL_154186 [Salvia splendens]
MADLSVRFEMKTLGEVECFLGLEVERADQGYFVSQRGYAKSLLERFNMGESKEMATPMESNLKLKKDEGKLVKDAKKFRQLVGSLIYLTIIKPEISYFVVVVVAQFMQNPRSYHLDAAKRILRYVKGTISYEILYKNCDNFLLSGFVDADWAGDSNDRCSEAEYVAETMAAQECVWLKRLIGDMLSNVDSCADQVRR